MGLESSLCLLLSLDSDMSSSPTEAKSNNNIHILCLLQCCYAAQVLAVVVNAIALNMLVCSGLVWFQTADYEPKPSLLQ